MECGDRGGNAKSKFKSKGNIDNDPCHRQDNRCNGIFLQSFPYRRPYLYRAVYFKGVVRQSLPEDGDDLVRNRLAGQKELFEPDQQLIVLCELLKLGIFKAVFAEEFPRIIDLHRLAELELDCCPSPKVYAQVRPAEANADNANQSEDNQYPGKGKGILSNPHKIYVRPADKLRKFHRIPPEIKCSSVPISPGC